LHFTVLVIGEDPEKLLEPFDENLEVPEYVKLTRASARKERVAEIRDLKRKLKKDPERKNMVFFKEKLVEIEEMSDEDYFKHKVRFHGSFNEKGEPLTTYNPKSQWDWFQIGGRWIGAFYLKHGAKAAAMSTPSRLGATSRDYMDRATDTMRCDSARLRDIDWDRMFEESKKEYEEGWDRYQEALKTMKPEVLGTNMTETKQAYMKKARKERVLIAYAVLTEDGEWHVPGPDDEDDRKEWDAKFWERFIKPLGPNTKLTMVDCHI